MRRSPPPRLRSVSPHRKRDTIVALHVAIVLIGDPLPALGRSAARLGIPHRRQRSARQPSPFNDGLLGAHLRPVSSLALEYGEYGLRGRADGFQPLKALRAIGVFFSLLNILTIGEFYAYEINLNLTGGGP